MTSIVVPTKPGPNAKPAEWQKYGEAMEKYARELAESQKQPGNLSLKVSKEKRALSLYGIQSRWPVTLYAEQWLRLKDFMPQIVKFIDENKTELAWKTAQ